MGVIHVDVTISNFADRSRNWTDRFLVDSGATDTVVPRDQLEAVGIAPQAQRVYELADGQEIALDIAGAKIEVMGEYTAGLVVFGEYNSEPLLGATVLESVGVEVDLRNQRLTKLSAVRLKAVMIAAFPKPRHWRPLVSRQPSRPFVECIPANTSGCS